MSDNIIKEKKDMKHSNSFTHDLAFGEEAEDWVKGIFTGAFKVEVKSDRMAHKTGNLFIEVFSRGKPSGISITTADIWIYRIEAHGTAIIVPTRIIKEVVRECFLKNNQKYTLGGDNNTSKGVLVPMIKLL